ncbi:ribonuclease E/G [Tanticharoenia sakaeratensis]|uniref:Ribonuclease E n=1 Tax=Tanticharoenia sakaeratensis NBRC 103193 TaxID=1231623 RepID=A0A0D6ML34_9PROT|nr:ribonuclease E/G [Tanticharoenia sakaeratensis]GAN54170.1 ribonuclease E [Tanticharoenia sakaeratensis NBRC 103193]
MNKRMLIDTTHAEETRVVVMDGERLEDYDVETSTKKQLKGNIYLAKVIRVEPSLQAAFVEYGGNRHGFLAFSEIHPDYFQIPVADREKLLALQEEDQPEDGEDETPEDASDEAADAGSEGESDEGARRRAPETVGGENDTGDESAAARRTARFLRGYKIQEVIRRRQVLLVQVVKEERGNKGAALTTYISLAGRYCVLMPNALRGGGVSRKITSDSDRKRLRETIAELNLPRGMAMIVRTAGAQRPAPEITRDCEYLLQLWDDIRSHTLSSIAPTLVYEEASLIKRAIRDLFSKDIEEIVIDGEAAWKSAREFMRMLMPHNVQKVKLWNNQGLSLFARYQVEGHLDAMFSPTAQLKSGGYLVINQTEALVAIDVNSGRSTSQRNVEETALRTNLEAAEEVARQLRLRDLAGLVVIDFIDMESRRHNAQVEKKLKDALRSDRARIQIGHISHFGLLEMSRQRLRPSIAESVLSPCPHCQGTGYVRGVESAALHVLRAIDEEGAKQRASEILVHVAGGVALYILNHKRSWLNDIEGHHRMHVSFQADETLMPSELRIDRLQAQTSVSREASEPAPAAIPIETLATTDGPADVAAQVDDEVETTPAEGASEDRSEGGRRRRRRRRRGRRDNQSADLRQDGAPQVEGEESSWSAAEQADEQATQDAEGQEDGEEAAPGLVAPGRRRTRLRRVRSEERRPHEERTPRDRHQPRPEPERRAWVGPTPADPFGGRFDIFDAIELAETAEAEAPTPRTRTVPIEAAPAPRPEPEAVVEDVVAETVSTDDAAPESEAPRRGRRPRRRGRSANAATVTEAQEAAAPQDEPTPDVVSEAPFEDAAVTAEPAADPVAVAEEAPAPRRRGRRPKAAAKAAAEVESLQAEEAAPAVAVTDVVEAPKAEPAAPVRRGRGRPRKSASATETAPAVEAETATEAQPAENSAAVAPINVDDEKPATPRAGWWRR